MSGSPYADWYATDMGILILNILTFVLLVGASATTGYLYGYTTATRAGK